MEPLIDLTGNTVDVSILTRLYGCLKQLNPDGSINPSLTSSKTEDEYFETLRPVEQGDPDPRLRERVLELYVKGTTLMQITATLQDKNYDQVVYLLLDNLWNCDKDLYGIPAEFDISILLKELFLSPNQMDDVRNVVSEQSNPTVRPMLALGFSPIQLATLITMLMIEDTPIGNRWKSVPATDFDVLIDDVEELVNNVKAGMDEAERLLAHDHDKYHEAMNEFLLLVPQINKQLEDTDAFMRENKKSLDEIKEKYLVTKKDKVANAELISDTTDIELMIDELMAGRDKEVSILEESCSSAVKAIPQLIPRLPPKEEMPRIEVGHKCFCKLPCLPEDERYEWARGTVTQIIPPSNGDESQFKYRVMFDRNVVPSKYPPRDSLVSGKSIAYEFELKWRLDEGERVVVHWRDESTPEFDGWYSAIIAEKPVLINKFRYLIFFDDNSVGYIEPQLVRLVCQRNPNPRQNYEEFARGDPTYYQFMKQYLTRYPERKMVLIKDIGVKLAVLRDGVLHAQSRAPTVVMIDASTIRLRYHNGDEEIMYRGSPRIALLNPELRTTTGAPPKRVVRRPTHVRRVELQFESTLNTNTESKFKIQVARKSTTQRLGICQDLDSGSEDEEVTEFFDPEQSELIHLPLTNALVKKENRLRISHKCSPACESQAFETFPNDAMKHFSKRPPFMLPLLMGWRRHLITPFGKVKSNVHYESPCGKMVRTCKEIVAYLETTNSCLSVDFFSFDFRLRPCHMYKTLNAKFQIADYSKGGEKMPIDCVNTYSNEPPQYILYAKERFPKNETVHLTKVCSSCDCVDDCSNSANCPCQQLTEYGIEALPKQSRPLRGSKQYSNRRLSEGILSGIYECNANCQCSKNRCVNRVAQHSISIPLQLFKTQHKGWGVRTLIDIPRGQFICIYAGAILTDTLAEQEGIQAGDEYFADLDLISVVEEEKEEYEDYSQSESEEEEEEGEADFLVTQHVTDKDKGDDPELRHFERDKAGGVVARQSARLHETQSAKSTTQSRKVTTVASKSSKTKETRDKKKGRSSKGVTLSKYFTTSQANYPFIIDAKTEGNIGRFLNHSCEPNVFVQNVLFDTHDLRLPDVAFFARTFIHAGEELCWDYNYQVGSIEGKSLPCMCKSNNCRKRLL